MHLGHATHEYSPELTVEHNGFANGTVALDYLAEHYPDAAQVGRRRQDGGRSRRPRLRRPRRRPAPRRPGHRVRRASPATFPTTPISTPRFSASCGAPTTRCPTGRSTKELTARDWGPPRFWIQAGLHDPAIVLARFDYAYDGEAAATAESLGLDPSELLVVIDANEATIEDAGVVLHSYTAPVTVTESSSGTSSMKSRSTASGSSTGSTRCSPVNHSTTSTARSANRRDR